jgi:BlaI family transcriptional regulator, penicillinase repressor
MAFDRFAKAVCPSAGVIRLWRADSREIFLKILLTAPTDVGILDADRCRYTVKENRVAKKQDNLPQLSDVQLEIMNIVWDEGEAGVAEVWQRISAKRPLARNTVQTLMTRLEDKGWLKHRAAGNAFMFSATVPRSQTLKRMVRSLVDVAFKGSAEDLVLALLQGRGVSDEEAERIRKMIDESKRG